jgi:hypothetical protein
MAVTTAVCNSFKRDILRVLAGQAAIFNAADTYRAVLIKAGHTGTYDANTTAVGTPGTGAPSTSNLGTDAVTASGTYTVGGGTATIAVTLSGSTALLDVTDQSYTGATISADGVIIYDDTAAGKPAVAVYSFGGTVTSTNGTFTVDYPVSGTGTSTLRIA